MPLCKYMYIFFVVQAMQYEIDHGIPVIQAEAVAGALKFTSGVGRGGKYSQDLACTNLMKCDHKLKVFFYVCTHFRSALKAITVAVKPNN